MNLQTEKGTTSLIFAIKKNRQDVVHLLATHPEIDVNLKDRSGLSPLHYAASCKKEHMIIILCSLLDHPNCNVNVQDENGYR